VSDIVLFFNSFWLGKPRSIMEFVLLQRFWLTRQQAQLSSLVETDAKWPAMLLSVDPGLCLSRRFRASSFHIGAYTHHKRIFLP
jgi:hypothetical protein